MTRHGYEVRADEVFWVKQGILRSTELRDSMDEQWIADIASCVVGGELIERSKDHWTTLTLPEALKLERVLSALEVYGSESSLKNLNSV